MPPNFTIHRDVTIIEKDAEQIHIIMNTDNAEILIHLFL